MGLVPSPSFPNPAAGWLSRVGNTREVACHQFPALSQTSRGKKNPTKLRGKKKIWKGKHSHPPPGVSAPTTPSIHPFPGLPIISHIPTPLEMSPVCGYTTPELCEGQPLAQPQPAAAAALRYTTSGHQVPARSICSAEATCDPSYSPAWGPCRHKGSQNTFSRVCILTLSPCQPTAQQPVTLSALLSSLPSIGVRHVNSSMTLKGFFFPPHPVFV